MRSLATQLFAASIALLLSAPSWSAGQVVECGSMQRVATVSYSSGSYYYYCETDGGAVAGLVIGLLIIFTIIFFVILPLCCGRPCCCGLFSGCKSCCAEKCACCPCCGGCEGCGDGCDCRLCTCPSMIPCCCCAPGKCCDKNHDACCCVTDAEAAALDAKAAAAAAAAAAAPVVVIASSPSSQPDASTKQESAAVISATDNNQSQQPGFAPPPEPQPQPQPLLPPPQQQQPFDKKQNATSSSSPADYKTGRFAHHEFATHEYQGALRVAASFKPTKSCKDYLLEDCAPLLPKVKQLPFIVDDCCDIADARLAKAAAKPNLYPQLTPDEALALAVYTYDLGVALEDGEENFFEAFSHLLLERNPGTMHQLAGYLYYFVHALNKMPLVDDNKITYRGVSGAAYDAIMETYRAGVSLHWSQFTSTSTDPTVAKQFAAQKTADGKPGILFVISVVAGHAVASHSAFANEQEVLLDANASLMVTQPPTPDPETGIVTCKLQQASGSKIIR